MSKTVKDMISQDVSRRLSGVEDALLVNVIGLDSGKTVLLRRQLREKNIHLLVVKNSIARRATEGTPLHAAFQGTEGSLAVIWGGEDFIALAKEVTKLDKGDDFPEFQTRGGVMDGERLTSQRVADISKWPNRQEQLSLLMGQILSPGAQLVSQLLAPAGALASQIEKKAKSDEADGSAGDAAG